MPDLPFIDLLSLTIREKKKENHNVGTSYLISFASIFSYLIFLRKPREMQQKGQCLPSTFFLNFLEKEKKKEKTPISSIVSGFWSYPYPYRIARRQHPSLGKYLYMYMCIYYSTRILDSAVLHAY